MSNFFKSSKNPKDSFPFAIPPKPKPILFSIASSSGSKVESNCDFNHCNPTSVYNLFILMDYPFMLLLW